MTSKRRTERDARIDPRSSRFRICPSKARRLCMPAMMALLLCLDAGGIGEAVAQDNVNIDDHVSGAKKLSMEAIAHEKKIHDRIQERDVLILEGDSWFSLPYHSDISEGLEELGYAVMSGANPGDTLENMAFGGQLSDMVAQFRRLFEYDKMPKAILLSVGGNDIVGPNLEFLLNHSRSTAFGQNGAGRWQDDILDSSLKRIQSHLIDYIVAISQMCDTLYSNEFEQVGADCGRIPIVIHGYDYPIPSGEGYKFLWFFNVKGPWLRPSFQKKMHDDDDTWNPRAILKRFIDRHNENLKSTVDALNDGDLANPVCYLNLRGNVQSWSDELHPDEAEMGEIATKFCIAIESGCSAASQLETNACSRESG